MFKFKKTVSLILALAMLASFMVVPSLAEDNATEYTDSGKNLKYTISGEATAVDNLTANLAFTGAALKVSASDSGGTTTRYYGLSKTPPSSGQLTDAVGVTAGSSSFGNAVEITKPTATGDYILYVNSTNSNDGTWSSTGLTLKVAPTGTGAASTISPDTDGYEVTATTVTPDTSGDTWVTPTAPDNTAFIIDLNTETITIPEAFKVEAYSLDGGTKWTAKALDVAKFSKMLNKEMTLMLTDSYDKKAKGPTKGVKAVAKVTDAEGNVTAEAVEAVKGSTVVTFPKIAARPKQDKIIANYLVGADATGKTNGTWFPTAKDATAKDVALLAALQVCIPKDNKKFTPNTSNPAEGDRWGTFHTDGEPVFDMKDGKAVKTTYLYRSKPITTAGSITPASKTMKAAATSVTKAPSLKPDYKKEIIKLKADSMLFFGKRDALAATTTPTVLTTKEAKANGVLGPIAKGDKDPVELKTYLTEAETYVTVWTNATAKKPASMKQEIVLAPRAFLPNDVVAGDKGKIKLDNTLEVYDSSKSKYAKLPKNDAAVTGGIIRLKNTAKAGKTDKTTAVLKYDGLAASADGTINVTHGVYETKLNKDGSVKSEKKGFLVATIIAPEYPGRLALVNPRIVAYTNTTNFTEITSENEGAMKDAFVTDGAVTGYAIAYDVYGLLETAAGGAFDTLGASGNGTVIKTAAAADPDASATLGTLAFATASGSGDQAKPARLFIPLASADAAGTVKVTVTLDLTNDGDTSLVNADNYDSKIYIAPFSFDIGKAEIANTAVTISGSGDNTDSNTALNTLTSGNIDVALTQQTTFTVAITGQTGGSDFTVSATPTTLKGTSASCSGAAVTFAAPTGTETAAQTVTVTIKLIGDADKNYEFAEGADTFTVKLTSVTNGS